MTSMVRCVIIWACLEMKGGDSMTKGELILALVGNKLPNDTEVLISVKKYHDGEATWDEISFVDNTQAGEPILIGLGATLMA